jgi:hypothetical protein
LTTNRPKIQENNNYKCRKTQWSLDGVKGVHKDPQKKIKLVSKDEKINITRASQTPNLVFGQLRKTTTKN